VTLWWQGGVDNMTKEEFGKSYNEIIEKSMLWSKKARCEGLLALEKMLDVEKYRQRDIMELGMQLVVDGVDSKVIDKILSNIINLEKDNDMKLLKNIQKEAVLGIQEGENPRLLFLLLSSYVDNDFFETTGKYLEYYG
jgi:flagellar motor component MotA